MHTKQVFTSPPLNVTIKCKIMREKISCVAQLWATLSVYSLAVTPFVERHPMPSLSNLHNQCEVYNYASTLLSNTSEGWSEVPKELNMRNTTNCIMKHMNMKFSCPFCWRNNKLAVIFFNDLIIWVYTWNVNLWLNKQIYPYS